MKTQNIKGYVINLARHPEKLSRFFQNPYSSFFEKITAVDRLDLEKFELENIVFDTLFLYEKYGISVTQREIAYTLSHILCWQMIAEDNDLNDRDYAIVAEDNISLCANFDNILSHVFNGIFQNQKDYEIVILHKKKNDHITKDEISFEDTVKSKNQYFLYDDLPYQYINDTGSALYLIRKDKAKSLLQFLESRKPYWLADKFELLCPDKIAIIYPYLGEIF